VRTKGSTSEYGSILEVDLGERGWLLGVVAALRGKGAQGGRCDRRLLEADDAALRRAESLAKHRWWLSIEGCLLFASYVAQEKTY